MRDTIKWITTIAKYIGLGLEYSVHIQMLPESWQFYGLVVFAGASVLKVTLVGIADVMDDGKRNNSIK